MFCCNCGYKIKDGDKFCENCGNPIYTEEETIILASGDEMSGAEEDAEQEDNPEEELKADPDTDSIPSLGQKIMKNMEDELILEMPMDQKSHKNAEKTKEPPAYEKIPVADRKKKTVKKKKTNKWVIILSVIVAVLIIAVAILAFMISNPVNKLKSGIKDRDWKRVESIYEKNFKGNDKREAKADEMFAGVVQSIESEFLSGSMDYQTAKRHLKAIEGFWDDDCVEDALEKLQKLNASSNAFEEAEKCMGNEDYVKAIRKYGEVVKEDAKYAEAQGRLETAKSKYKEQAFGEAKAYEELKDYDAAIRTIEEALRTLSGDKDLQERLEELTEGQDKYAVQSVLDQAKRYAEQKNYYSAMDLLKNILAERPNDRDIKEAFEEYQKAYEEDILKKAEAALGEDENYDAAIIVLESAMKTLGGDYPEIERELKEKKEEYTQKQIQKSEQENAAAAIIGTWHVIKVSYNGAEMSSQEFLTGLGMQDVHMRLDFYETGGFYMDILGEAGSGQWSQDEIGSDTYFLNDGANTFTVKLNGTGNMTMDLNGVLMTFERGTSV